MEQLIQALQIFQKYNNEDYPTACEHDTLYVNVNPDSVSEDDKVTLERLGFTANDTDGNFYSHKYGSC